MNLLFPYSRRARLHRVKLATNTGGPSCLFVLSICLYLDPTLSLSRACTILSYNAPHPLQVLFLHASDAYRQRRAWVHLYNSTTVRNLLDLFNCTASGSSFFNNLVTSTNQIATGTKLERLILFLHTVRPRIAVLLTLPTAPFCTCLLLTATMLPS